MGSGKYNASLEDIKDPRRLMHLIQDMQAHGRQLSDANERLIRELSDLKRAATPLIGGDTSPKAIEQKQVEATLNTKGVTGHIPLRVEGAVGILGDPQYARLPWRGINGYQDQIANPVDGQLVNTYEDAANGGFAYTFPLYAQYWHELQQKWLPLMAGGKAIVMTTAEMDAILTAQISPYPDGTLVWLSDYYIPGILYFDLTTVPPSWWFLGFELQLYQASLSGFSATAAAPYWWIYEVQVADYSHCLQYVTNSYSWSFSDAGSGYIQGFAFAPTNTVGWQLCNGTANVKYLKGDGTTGTINLPNLVGHFPKFNTAAPNPPVANAAGQTANITPNTGVSTAVTAQNVVGCSSANPTVVTLAAAHTCSVGDVVKVAGILKGGVGSAVNGVRAITGTGATTLTFNVNTGAEGAYTAGTGSVTDDSANLAHTHDTGNPPYTELLPYFRK